jgi:MoxR-like ATPase
MCVQVAAYTSGKDSVSLLDCMLLQHILWQQPEQQSRITDFLLSQISEDDGLQSASYILGSEFLA